MTLSRNIAASKAMRLQDKANRLAVEGKYAKSELLSSKADSLWHLVQHSQRTGVRLDVSSHLSLVEESAKTFSLPPIPRPAVATAYIPGACEDFNASLTLMIDGALDLSYLAEKTSSFEVVPDLDSFVLVPPRR